MHTAKWVVDEALLGDLIKDRTVILVTHNIALAAPVAEHVVNLEKNGTVVAQGSVADVMKKDYRLREQAEYVSKIIHAEVGKEEEEKDQVVTGDENPHKTKRTEGKLMIAEEKAMGRVQWSAFKLFVDGVGNVWIWVALALVFWSSMFVNICQRWVMAWWTAQYDTHAPSEIPVILYVRLDVTDEGTSTDYVQPSSPSIQQVGHGDRIGGNRNHILDVPNSQGLAYYIHANLMESIFTSSFRFVPPFFKIRYTGLFKAIQGGWMSRP